MARIVFLIVFFIELFTVFTLGAENGPTLEHKFDLVLTGRSNVEEATFHFPVSTCNATRKALVSITNHTAKPIDFENFAIGCKCTSATISKKHLDLGEVCELELTIAPDSTPVSTTKHVTAQVNAKGVVSVIAITLQIDFSDAFGFGVKEVYKSIGEEDDSLEIKVPFFISNELHKKTPSFRSYGMLEETEWSVRAEGEQNFAVAKVDAKGKKVVNGELVLTIPGEIGERKIFVSVERAKVVEVFPKKPVFAPSLTDPTTCEATAIIQVRPRQQVADKSNIEEVLNVLCRTKSGSDLSVGLRKVGPSSYRVSLSGKQEDLANADAILNWEIETSKEVIDIRSPFLITH